MVGALNLGDKTLPTGFVSQFLVLGALDPDGTVRLLEFPDGILPGSMVAYTYAFDIARVFDFG